MGVIGRLAHDFEDGALVLHEGFLVAALRGFQAQALLVEVGLHLGDVRAVDAAPGGFGLGDCFGQLIAVLLVRLQAFARDYFRRSKALRCLTSVAAHRTKMGFSQIGHISQSRSSE